MKPKLQLLIGFLTVLIPAVYGQDFDSKLNDAKNALIEAQNEKALGYCEELITAGNEDSTKLALAFGYAGMACEGLDRTTDALDYYSKAVSYSVPQLDVYDKLISLSKKEKNNEVYEFALKSKAKEFPDYYSDVTKSLAYLYVNSQQYDKLLNTTDELLNWYPENKNYLFFKGVALQNLSKPDEATEYFKQVLALDPDHPGANMSVGLALFNQGSEIFELRKKEYEALAKPTRVDYSVYEKGIEKGKTVYREALPYLLKAYNSGKYPSLKQALFRTYVLLEEKDKAEPYR